MCTHIYVHGSLTYFDDCPGKKSTHNWILYSRICHRQSLKRNKHTATSPTVRVGDWAVGMTCDRFSSRDRMAHRWLRSLVFVVLTFQRSDDQHISARQTFYIFWSWAVASPSPKWLWKTKWADHGHPSIFWSQGPSQQWLVRWNHGRCEVEANHPHTKSFGGFVKWWYMVIPQQLDGLFQGKYGKMDDEH